MSIQTSDECMESYPCQHIVIIGGVNKGTWNGVTIYQYYVDNHLRVPSHFQEYKSIVDKSSISNAFKNGDIDYIKTVNMSDLSDHCRSDSALVQACGISLDMVKVIHEYKGVKMTAPQKCLVEAAKYGKIDIVKYLVEKGLTPDAATGMHYISCGGKTAYSMAAYHGWLDVLKYFDSVAGCSEQTYIDSCEEAGENRKKDNSHVQAYISHIVDTNKRARTAAKVRDITSRIKDRSISRDECVKMMSETSEPQIKDLVWEHLKTFM